MPREVSTFSNKNVIVTTASQVMQPGVIDRSLLTGCGMGASGSSQRVPEIGISHEGTSTETERGRMERSRMVCFRSAGHWPMIGLSRAEGAGSLTICCDSCLVLAAD